MMALSFAPSRGRLDMRLLMAGSAALSISTLFSSMKPVLISGLVEQAGYSAPLAGLAAAMPFIGGVAASLLLLRLGPGADNRRLRQLSAALPVLELGNALWFAHGTALLLGQFAVGLCGGMILGLVSRLIARSARSGETFGMADAVGVLLMSVMLAGVGSAVDLAGVRGGFLVAAFFCALFALLLHAGLQDTGGAEGGRDEGTLPQSADRSAWQSLAIIAMGVGFVTFSGLGFAFMITVARQLGLGYQAASSGIGLVLFLSASGCFIGGWTAARFGPRRPLLGAFALCAAGWHIALHAHDPATFFIGLGPAILALQFCFPILLSLAGAADHDGRMAAIGAPVIVSGFAWAAVLAGLIVRHGGIDALSIATDGGMVLCAALLWLGTQQRAPRLAQRSLRAQLDGAEEIRRPVTGSI